MKSQEATAHATAEVKKQGLSVIYASEVEKIHDTKAKSDNRILVLTNISAIYYTTGSRPKSSRVMYWADLNKVEIIDDMICLYFDCGQMRFKSQSLELLKEKIGDLIQRIFSPGEASQLNISEFTSRTYPQCAFGYYSRLLSHAALHNVKIDQKFLSSFSRVVCYRCDEVSIPKEMNNEFPSYMYGIEPITYVESVKFPNLTSFDVFQKLVQTPIYCKHIHFKGTKLTSHLSKFCTCIKNNQYINLDGISFTNVKLRENDFKSICECCSSRKFTSLSFNNSLKEKHYEYFTKDFLNNEVISNLQMVNLNITPNLDMPMLLYKIRDIYSLSLENCELDIDITLQNIAHTRMVNLRMLNLSGNYANTISQDISFPEDLQTLYVRNVDWGTNCLAPFLSAVSVNKWKGDFYLSIRDIKADANEINSLKSCFANIRSTNITHLDWKNNLLIPEFITYMEKAKNLIEIDVSNCFTTETLPIFGQFVDFVGNSHLTNLIICGDEHCDLGTEMFKLFDSIKVLKTLKYINITKHKIGNEGIKLFCEAVVANPSIEKVSFKGCGLDSIEVFHYVINKLRHRRNPIQVEWPTDETNAMMSRNEVKKKKLNHYKGSILRLAKEELYFYTGKGHDDDSALQESNPMTQTLEVYFFDTEKPFPNYVSYELSDKFNGPLHKSPVKGYPQNRTTCSKKKLKNRRVSKQSEVSEESSSEKKSLSNSFDDKSRRKSSQQSYYLVTKNHRRNRKDTSDGFSDDSDDDYHRKRKQSRRLLSNCSSDNFVKKKRVQLNSSSDDDDNNNRKKKMTKRRLTDLRSDSDSDNNSDRYVKGNTKKRSFHLDSSGSDQRRNQPKKAKRKITFSDDLSENDLRRSPRKKKTSSSHSNSDSDNDFPRNPQKRQKSSASWEFPKSILPPENDKKYILQMKDKFSLANLMETIVNNMDD